MLKAIDVSKYQADVDWNGAIADGFSVGIVRAGLRGYLYGNIQEDPYAEKNISGAQKAGIKLGVYFFSQAVNTAEAKEEADFCLSLLNGRDCPAGIWFDSEYGNYKRTGRADALDKETRTNCAKTFCETCRSSGYISGVYASTSWFESKLSELALPLWVADYRGYCGHKTGDIYGWQYASTETYSWTLGNNHKVDTNEWYQTFEKAAEPLSADPVIMECVATGADMKQLSALCEALSILYTANENVLLTSVPVSTGDQLKLCKTAAELGIQWKIVSPEKEKEEATAEEGKSLFRLIIEIMEKVLEWMKGKDK